MQFQPSHGPFIYRTERTRFVFQFDATRFKNVDTETLTPTLALRLIFGKSSETFGSGGGRRWRRSGRLRDAYATYCDDKTGVATKMCAGAPHDKSLPKFLIRSGRIMSPGVLRGGKAGLMVSGWFRG